MKNAVVKKQYTKEILQKLKANIKLEEVVGKDSLLKKFGKNYFTVCPFCGAILFGNVKKHQVLSQRAESNRI